MNQLLQYLMVFLLGNTLFMVLGFTIVRFFLNKIVITPFNIFIAHILGIIISVTIISLYCSSGITVNIICIPLLFLLLRSISMDKEPYEKRPSIVIFQVISCLFVFSIFIIKYYNFQLGGAVNAHLDYLTYANISEYLLNIGIENGSLNYFYPEQIPPAPYHYFELWLNAMFYRMASYYSLNTLLFITFPTLLFSFLLGIISLFANYTSSMKYYSLGFLLVFVCGTSFDFYTNISLFREIDNLSYSPLEYYKLLVPSIFVLLSLNFFVRKQINSALIVLLFLPVVNVLFILFVPIITILISFSLYYRRIQLKGFALKHLLYGVLFALSIFLFYKLNSIGRSGSIGREDGLLFNSIKYLSNPPYLITAFNIFCKSIVQICILYFPYLIFFILLSFYFSIPIIAILRKRKFLAFICFGTLFYALGCWSLFHWFFNSFQFFIIPASIIINTGLTFVVLYFIVKLNLLDGFNLNRMLALSLLLVIPVLHGFRILGEKGSSRYDISFLREVQKVFISDSINPIGGYIKDYDESDNFSNKSPSYIIEGDFLEYTSKGTFPTSLTAFNMGISSDSRKAAWEKNRRMHSPICTFYDKSKERDDSISDSEIIRRFINESSIEYVVLEHSEQLLDLNLNITKSISDPKSGCCIVFLKKD